MKKDRVIAVIGGGMIGTSLCALLTGNGYRTLLYVRSRAQERLEKYQEIMNSLVEDGCMKPEEKERCETYFSVVTSWEELKEAHVAFECAAENAEVKGQIYENLYRHCPNLVVVASATSAISSEMLAENSKMPEKVLVAHPFYPPHLIPCVEVVPNRYTDPEALQVLLEILRETKREAVLLKKDAPGFVGNRLQYAMLREAVYIVEQGIADPEDVDRVLTYSFAPRYTSIGLFEHFDNCGLDLAGTISTGLYPELCDAKDVQEYVRSHCEKGEQGVRSGKGTYDWSKKDRKDFEMRIKRPYLAGLSWDIPGEAYAAVRTAPE